jgi:hypothetical protein
MQNIKGILENPVVQLYAATSIDNVQILATDVVEKEVLLPANLINSIVNVEAYNGDVPLGETDPLSGTVTIRGQYNNSKPILAATIDLATAEYTIVEGNFTKLLISVTGLTGADNLVVTATQAPNVIPVAQSGGGGVIGFDVINPCYAATK